jgi:hypothetical protein
VDRAEQADELSIRVLERIWRVEIAVAKARLFRVRRKRRIPGHMLYIRSPNPAPCRLHTVESYIHADFAAHFPSVSDIRSRSPK